VTRRFRTEPEASLELEEAAQWYEQRRSGLGIEFLEEIDRALEFIVRYSWGGRSFGSGMFQSARALRTGSRRSRNSRPKDLPKKQRTTLDSPTRRKSDHRRVLQGK